MKTFQNHGYDMFNLLSGSLSYVIKKDFVHLYVNDSFNNQIELIATKEQLKLLLKVITN